MAGDEQFYSTVAEEIEKGQIYKALWTKAFALSGGEESATKSQYCRLRAEQLKNASKQERKSILILQSKLHGKQLGFGVFLFTIGLVVTGFSYNKTEPEGHYFISSGLLVGGFITICKGLWGLCRVPFTLSKPASSRPSGSPTCSNNSEHSPGATSQGCSTEEAKQTPPHSHEQFHSPSATPGAEKPFQFPSRVGLFVVFLFMIAIVWVVILVVDAKTVYSTPPPALAPASSPAITPESHTIAAGNSIVIEQAISSPGLNREAEQQVVLDRKFSELDSEFRMLTNRRSCLNLSNVSQVTAFNQDAADYSRRLQLAREEKVRLQEKAPFGFTVEQK